MLKKLREEFFINPIILMKIVTIMVKPSYKDIEELAKVYNTIPVSKEIYADVITPITLLRKLAQISTKYYLLESVEGGERWGRYSFLGFDPILHVTCKDSTVTISGDDIRKVYSDKPLNVLRKLISDYRAPRLDFLPPFTGGFVGYFSYSMIKYAEPTIKIKNSEFNDFEMMLFDKVIAYDHLKQKILIVVNMRSENLRVSYEKALNEIEKIHQFINNAQPLESLHTESAADFRCNVSKDEYCSIVEKTKKYIFDGDIFQAVLSRRFESQYYSSLINAYRILRTTNPSPYMVFMHMNDMEIMSTSPETLVSLKDGRLSTFPVAGSRPRGGSADEDKALEMELLKDEKELSEHNMLVDLARNDLGKISKFSSVEVTNYMMIHRYSKIMHITSSVESDIQEGCDAFSAIEAVLPAGTLSGAPKVRACQIIEELENGPRGIYGGAIGYMDFTGNMDTCIAIRMAVKKGHQVYVQSGGGIVADSIPEMEYEESANKAAAVINAIINASEVNDV